MKRLTVLCAVILLVLLSGTLVTSCQQQPAAAPPPPAPAPTPAPSPPPPPPPLPAPETLTYTNSEYGFSVEYPADWDVMEDFMGAVVFLAGPMVLEDQFMVNVSIRVTELLEEITLEDLVKIGELQDKRNIPNYNKVEEYNTTIAELAANVQTITALTKLNGDEILLKDAIARFVTGKVAYVITYDVPEQFHDEYIDSFELVISAFKFE